jgi:hypothetical protein
MKVTGEAEGTVWKEAEMRTTPDGKSPAESDVTSIEFEFVELRGGRGGRGGC